MYVWLECRPCEYVPALQYSFFSPTDVVVQFDPASYSVLEGDSVDITLTADRDFSVPFNVTLSSNNVEGRLMCMCIECMLVCMCVQGHIQSVSILFLPHPDVRLQSTVATFQPSSRTVSVTLDALADDMQELNEVVTLGFEVTARIGVSKGDNDTAEVTVTDTTTSES